MITRKFETPFGYFEVLYNGKTIDFQIEEGTYNTYSLGRGEGIVVHPDGCFEVLIDINL